MNRIAKFHKVSWEQFLKDYIDTFGEIDEERILEVQEIYDGITLPKRATKGSAGYDFITPVPIKLTPNTSMKIPTGIKCSMNEGWVLNIYPRSGLGFKYRVQLDNTVGIIDEDYFYSNNEGHIFIKITNDTNEFKTVEVEAGKGFAQGIFLQYGITIDDDADGIRDGGFGSTGV